MPSSSFFRRIIFLSSVGLLSLTALSCVYSGPQPVSVASTKRGFGLAERLGYGQAHLDALHVAWYYNWGPKTKLNADARFVPMVFSGKTLASTPAVEGDTVLGFNEPDHPRQSNMSVAQALELWPKVIEGKQHVGSPAMAGNTVTSEWLTAFMEGKPRVDFIAVHWYKGVDAQRYIRDMQAIHENFKKPIWVTEFAAQTMAQSKAAPDRYTQEQVNRFIAQVTQWMDATPYVERYAWHDSRVGTSALFTGTGELTETGRAYAKLTMSTDGESAD